MLGRMSRAGVVLVALGMLHAPATGADGTCEVKVAAELESQEASEDTILLVFDVRLEASCDCASATYDLVLEELLPNQQWKAVRETRRVDLRGASATDRVEHRMGAEIKLLGFSVKPVESTPCG